MNIPFISHNSQNNEKRKNLLPKLQIKGAVWGWISQIYEFLILKLHTPKFHMEPEPLEKKDPLGNPSFSGFQFLPIPSASINKSFPNSPRRKPPWCDLPAACRASPLSPIAMHIVIHEGRLMTKASRKKIGSFLEEKLGEDEDVKMDLFQKNKHRVMVFFLVTGKFFIELD